MKTPKGKLIPIGGNEARDYGERENSEQIVDFENGILKDVLKEIPYKDPRILLLTLASSKQEELAKDYTRAFRKLGYEIEIIRDDDDQPLDSEDNIRRLQDAHCLFLTGGDQARLKQIMEGTKFLEMLRKKYFEEDFIIAGTSAGAMILSTVMINDGVSEMSLLKGIVTLSEGIDLLPDAIIDTHFLARGRLSRLAEALIKKRNCIGIGICEDTALVITNGHELSPLGSGTVTILETWEVQNTNYEQANEKEPVFVDNMKIHFLAKGTKYNLKERKLIVSEEIYA